MLKPIEVNFKLDKTIKRAHSTELMIKSHDINVIEFHISFDGLELTADHTVEVLSVFSDTGSQTNVNCEIADGKAIYRPDTSIISQYDYVRNYVYVYHGDQSLDAHLFTYSVNSSEIDKTAIKVKTVYDQSYTELLTEFEARLQDYKDSLPQASDLRAEVDVILNKLKTDSDAKLSQYDADAQQVIADNQTAFGLAESNRQSTYEQAEDSRNQASNRAVVDWEQGADALLETVESNESARVDAETTRKTAETDRVSSEATRKTNETTRISSENARESAEVIRLTSEVDRVNAEVVRSEFYEGFDGRLDSLESDRFVLKNLFPVKRFTITGYGTVTGVKLDFEIGNKYYTSRDFVIVKGNPNEITGRVTDLSGQHLLSVGAEHSEVITYAPSSGDGKNRVIMVYGVNKSDEFGESEVLFDNLTLIDLTATFGAGNEPSKEWMDGLIEQTGYFDEHILTENWQVGEIVRLNEAKVNKVQEDWITPTLLNGWTGDVKYRKDNFEIVHFKGKLTPGTGAAFQLPSRYVPSQTLTFSVPNNGALLKGSARCVVEMPSGNVWFREMDSAHWFDISGITYFAEV